MRAMRACAALGLLILLVALAAAAAACRALEPSSRPLDRCRASCESKARRQCDARQCERGCEMILDRILEREGENVIACVATGARTCTDVVWADCAAKIGAHADGGPPAPAPAGDDE